MWYKKSAEFLTAFAVVCVMLMSFCALSFASPEALSPEIESTASGLITIKAPETELLSTTNKFLPVSASAPQGVVVTIYRYSAASNTYNKLYSDGAPLEAAVGATMLFASQVELFQGSNKFIVRSAYDDNTYQIARFEVNLLNERFMDKIRSIAGILFN